MIHVEHLRKSYGSEPVLRGLSLRARQNEVTLLVGPNGAGKSTTMKVLAGLVRADEGVALLSGYDLGRDKLQAQQSLAYLPQNPAFHPRFTSRQILTFYARLRGVNPARIEFALDHMGLLEKAAVRTGALSGGTRQRLGIALLLLADAPVLLLDEPGLSLDPGWRKRLQEILRAEAGRGKTVLVTTHLISEWNGVADRCLLCRSGRITNHLDPANLPSDFDHLEPLPGSAPEVAQGQYGWDASLVREEVS